MCCQTRAVRRATLVLLACLAAAPSAEAQAPQGDMTFPARGTALRPTGLAQLRAGWMARYGRLGSVSVADSDFSFQELEVRVPLGGVVLEAAVGMSQQILWNAHEMSDDNAVILRAQNPELGAFFSDAPADGWRYELGGSIGFPVDASEVVDALNVDEPGYMPLFRALPVETTPGEERVGWHAHRYRREAVVAVPRAYVEYAPLPELVLAARLEVPVHVVLDGDVGVYPQGSLAIAYRDEGRRFVGLRTRFTSWGEIPFYGPERMQLGVAMEPFVRVGFLERDFGGFVRLAAVFPIVFAYPLVGIESSSSEATRGYFGGELSIGALY